MSQDNSRDSGPETSADIEAIKQLKYRYLRTLDLKLWDEFAECFVPEATGDYDELAFADRASLVEYMRANLGEGLISMHTRTTRRSRWMVTGPPVGGTSRTR